MSQYKLHADESMFKKLPLWAWVALAAGVVLVVLGLRRKKAKSELEDYLH